MNFYFITGASKGLGKAFAEELLNEADNFVYGISRSFSIEHERYQHIECDLSNQDALDSFKFPKLQNPKKIMLINNAGRLGTVTHVNGLSSQDVDQTNRLNITVPMVLTSLFLSHEGNYNCDKLVINISSGAAHRPVDGWSVYCSSKSALEMFTCVVNEELKIQGKNTSIRCFSIAPGIVDTEMQTQIRSSSEADFSNVNTFKDYKNNNDLASPKETAKKILRILVNWKTIKDSSFSVRDY